MGKRSDFERKPRDFYRTPIEAVVPLIPHLEWRVSQKWIEPCAGDAALIDHIDHLTPKEFLCTEAYDIHPMHDSIMEQDFFDLEVGDHIDYVITNPPWDRKFLHPMLEKCRTFPCPTWLLFDADWPHTKQSSTFMEYCDKIVAVGRVKWIPDSKFTGKDNCCWYRFQPNPTPSVEFIGR